MSNKIPIVVEEYSKKHGKKDEISYLSFIDWLSKKEHESHDWVVVARFWKEDAEDFFTYSVLASTKNESLTKIISEPKWDVRFQEFGKPSFYGDYRSGKDPVICYDPGLITYLDGVEFRLFVIYRDFHGYVPRTFEIVQNFVLYHEAFFVPEKNEFQRIDKETGDVHSVIRFKIKNENIVVEVDSSHLKDYLAANQSYLVRYHDHHRHAIADITEDIGDNFKSGMLNDRLYCFELWLRTDNPINGYISSSRLYGKDVVTPYPNPDKSHSPFVEREEKEFVEFIIGLDEDGNPIKSTCDESKLSNYFVDRGSPHSLTPVYFKKEVLSKYYQEPRRYRVDDAVLRCLDLWSLLIDITEEDLVQVWLKDLGDIPFKEQLYWRTFNVVPRGSITEHRWKRDFLAQPANPVDNPVFYFKKAFTEAQNLFLEKYGTTLFLDLNEKDSHVYGTLHLPLTEEWKELDEQVQGLAKITSDSLNVKFLQKKTGVKIGDEVSGREIKGSIDLFELYLVSKNVEEISVSEIINPLRSVQSIRSSGAAHRKGSEYDKTLKRYELHDKSNHEKVKILVNNLTDSLNAVIGLLSEDN